MPKGIKIIALMCLVLAILPGCVFAAPIESMWYRAENSNDDGITKMNLTAGATSAYQPGKMLQAFYFDGLRTSAQYHANNDGTKKNTKSM